MKEYKEKFIWNKFINEIIDNYSSKFNISEMIIESSDEENFIGNNEDMILSDNYLYNETFLDDNDMILDD